MRHFFNLSKEKKVWEILENTSKNTKINILNSIFSRLYYSLKFFGELYENRIDNIITQNSYFYFFVTLFRFKSNEIHTIFRRQVIKKKLVSINY